MNPLQCVGTIADFVEHHSLTSRDFNLLLLAEKQEKQLEQLQSFFKKSIKFTNRCEVLVFGICLYLGLEETSFGIGNIAKLFSTKKSDLYLNHFHMFLKTLHEKGVLVKEEGHYGRRGEYSVNENILNCVLYNDPLLKSELNQNDTLSILLACRELSHSNEERNGFDSRFAPIKRNISRCKDPFIAHLRTLNFTSIDLYIVLFVAFATLDEMESGFNVGDLLDDIFRKDFRKGYNLKKQFAAGLHPLILGNYVKLAGSGNQINQDVLIELSDDLKDILYKDQEIEPEKKRSKDFKYYTESDVEPMFFDDDLKSEIDRLVMVIKRMEETDFNALCCLLHGAPGTGKSESVKLIGALTGRGIMKISLDSFRNSFYGESERLTTKLFNSIDRHYRNGLKPIVFIDEIDGILEKRREQTNSATEGVDHRLQNIILDRLTNLPKGCVLIGTSNLITNMDSAYHRRFPIQVEYKLGGYDSRFKVWHSLVGDDPNIKEYSNFELTPALIKNIAHQIKTDKVLFGSEPDKNRIIQMIEKELHYSGFGSQRKVGF